MFLHQHPYSPFIPVNATKLIVGTLPPPRFSLGKLKEGDVRFCYGSRDGQLWPILNQIFSLNLEFEASLKAIKQRKAFLIEKGIGICDIVKQYQRERLDASDLNMHHIELRDVLSYLQKYPKITTILFMGGNCKNGPEYFFRQQLKYYGLKLEVIFDEVPRVHQFSLTPSRSIKTVSLSSPSGAANRAVGGLETYKILKESNPNFNTVDFRVQQYKDFF